METPEKVYLLFNRPYLVDYTKLNKRRCDEEVEYIRTDAFIEKACVELKKLMYDNLMFQGRLYREEVIDNFVESFKNYIKGE